MKIICKGHEFQLELSSSEPCRGDLLFANLRLSALPKENLYIPANTDSQPQRRHLIEQTTGAAMASIRDPVYFFLLAFSTGAVSCCSSVFCQLESGLYSFMPVARTSVFLPRSF